jgi:hypothetical protein
MRSLTRRSGISKMNVEPLAELALAQMRPPCISTNFLRDRQAEARAAVFARNRGVGLLDSVKRPPILSAGMPIPVSCTL